MLESHRVEVRYRLTEALSEDDLDAAMALLSPEERARRDRFHFARDRRDYAVAHALLRASLARADGPPVRRVALRRRSRRGKPTLPAWTIPRADRSRSICRTRTASSRARSHPAPTSAWTSNGSIAARTPTPIAGRYFAPSEIAWLRAAPAEAYAARFITLWTLKEAYLKATGEGISESLTKMAFEVGDDGRIAFTAAPGVERRAWQFETFRPAPGYVLSVAVDAARGPMTIEMGEARSG